MAIWLFIVSSALAWNLADENREHERLALKTAKAFFELINISRYWNSKHGGVYVPITEETQPNPYLIDPLKTLTTDTGQQLTKINPAYMTRQISEIADQLSGVKFHITSLNPIRPDNKAEPWEKQWLESFEEGAKEHGEFVNAVDKKIFRYMAPLITKSPCLKCHEKQGYSEGDIRGGISVTLQYLPKESYSALITGYGVAAVGGLLLILIGGVLLERSRLLLVQSNEDLQTEVIERKKAEATTQHQNKELKEALSKVKVLSGFLPICASCKKIRDDNGYWNQIEAYIRDHSDAEFSHGVCPDCAKELYPGFYKKMFPENEK